MNLITHFTFPFLLLSLAVCQKPSKTNVIIETSTDDPDPIADPTASLNQTAVEFTTTNTASTATLNRGVGAGGNTACGNPSRIRQPWESLTSEAKGLYLEALSLLISNGMLKEFQKVHMDHFSDVEAHNTCGFILWHRYYLLALENAIRSLAEKFACVTIPYINFPENVKAFINGECGNFADCSVIMKEMGGLPESQDDVSRVYNNRRVTGKCIKAFPFSDEYCDEKGACGCALRDDLSKKEVPSSGSYPLLYQQITSIKTYKGFSKSVEFSIHGEAHLTIGGTMSSISGPFDPIFYSLHSFVDLLHAVWHQCHIGSPFTKSDMESDFAFDHQNSCMSDILLTSKGKPNRSEKKAAGVYAERMAADATTPEEMTIDNIIYMQSGGVDVRENELIGHYFQIVGDTYAQNVGTGMGDYKYTYELHPAWNIILDNPDMCPAAKDRVVATVAPTDLKDAAAKDRVVATVAPTDLKDAEVTPASEPIDEQTQWFLTTTAELKLQFPNDPDEVIRQMAYLQCKNFDDKFGVTEFEDTEFLSGADAVAPCVRTIKEFEASTSMVAPTILDKQKTTWGVQATALKEDFEKVLPNLSNATAASGLDMVGRMTIGVLVWSSYWATL